MNSPVYKPALNLIDFVVLISTCVIPFVISYVLSASEKASVQKKIGEQKLQKGKGTGGGKILKKIVNVKMKYNLRRKRSWQSSGKTKNQKKN